MHCVYEFELYRGKKHWIIEAYDIPAITEGDDVADACECASDLIASMMHDSMMEGRPMPEGTFGHEPKNGGVNVIVSVETTLDAIEKVSATEAARMLGVGRARVTAMLESGLLDGWRDGRNTWVSLDSVKARKASAPKPGRPRKEKALA